MNDDQKTSGPPGGPGFVGKLVERLSDRRVHLRFELDGSVEMTVIPRETADADEDEPPKSPVKPCPPSPHKVGDTISLWTDLRGTAGLVLTRCGRICVAHPTVGLIWASSRPGPGIGPSADAWPVRLLALGSFEGEDLNTPLVDGLIAEVERLVADRHARRATLDDLINALEMHALISQREADECTDEQHVATAAKAIREYAEGIQRAHTARSETWRALVNLARRLGVPIEENAAPAALADLIHAAAHEHVEIADAACRALGIWGYTDRADLLAKIKAGGDAHRGSIAELEERNARQAKMLEGLEARLLVGQQIVARLEEAAGELAGDVSEEWSDADLADWLVGQLRVLTADAATRSKLLRALEERERLRVEQIEAAKVFLLQPGDATDTPLLTLAGAASLRIHSAQAEHESIERLRRELSMHEIATPAQIADAALQPGGTVCEIREILGRDGGEDGRDPHGARPARPVTATRLPSSSALSRGHASRRSIGHATTPAAHITAQHQQLDEEAEPEETMAQYVERLEREHAARGEPPIDPGHFIHDEGGDEPEDDDGPVVCGGCYAIGAEPHAGYCIDARIAAQLDEERHGANLLDEDQGDDHGGGPRDAGVLGAAHAHDDLTP